MASPAAKQLTAAAAAITEATSSLQRALGEIRGRIAELKEQIERLGRSPGTRAEMEAKVRSFVGDLAADADHSPSHLMSERLGHLNNARESLGLKQPSELLAAIVPEQMIEWMMRRLDYQAKLIGGWSDKGREAREALMTPLREQLFRLEQDEEQLIVSAEQHGISIARRPDADPAAVLGLPARQGELA